MHEHIQKAFILYLKNKKSLWIAKNRIIERRNDALKENIEELKKTKEQLEIDIMLLKALSDDEEERIK